MRGITTPPINPKMEKPNMTMLYTLNSAKYGIIPAMDGDAVTYISSDGYAFDAHLEDHATLVVPVNAKKERPDYVLQIRQSMVAAIQDVAVRKEVEDVIRNFQDRGAKRDKKEVEKMLATLLVHLYGIPKEDTKGFKEVVQEETLTATAVTSKLNEKETQFS